MVIPLFVIILVLSIIKQFASIIIFIFCVPIILPLISVA